MAFYDLNTGKSVSQVEHIRGDGEAAIENARQLEQKARDENRAFTPDEQAAYDQHVGEAKQCVEAMKTARADTEFVEKVGQMFGGMPGSSLGGTPAGKDRRLSFASMGAAIAAKTPESTPNVKALATGGSVVTGQEFTADPIALGRVATSVLDVVPVTVHATDQLAYLRQSARTFAAAIVPEGSVKPTSTLTVVRVEDRLDVVAHLSEPVPRFWLVDNVALEQFLTLELEFGLGLAVQAMIVSDVAGTSGVQTQTYSVSVLQTLRKTLTKLETQGYAPQSIWVNPADFEAVELALSTVNAVEHVGLPYSAADRRLWGVPLVVSTAVTAGVSYSVADGAVGLNTDGRGVETSWSEQSNADDWSKNLIRARTEGRYCTSVFAPLGVVVGDLTP